MANVLRFTLVPGSGDVMNGVYAYGTPEAGNSRLLSPKFLLLAPRGGFAWSPFGNKKTVIRGGFGWAYNRENIAQAVNAFENGLSGIASLVQTSLATMSAPTTVQPIAAKSIGARDEANRERPTVYDSSLSLQHELPFGTVLEAAYIGNLQRHQPIQFNINAVPLGISSKTSDAVIGPHTISVMPAA